MHVARAAICDEQSKEGKILSKSLVKGGLPRKKDAYGLHTISLLAWCRFQLHRAPVQRD